MTTHQLIYGSKKNNKTEGMVNGVLLYQTATKLATYELLGHLRNAGETGDGAQGKQLKSHLWSLRKGQKGNQSKLKYDLKARQNPLLERCPFPPEHSGRGRYAFGLNGIASPDVPAAAGALSLRRRSHKNPGSRSAVFSVFTLWPGQWDGCLHESLRILCYFCLERKGFMTQKSWSYHKWILLLSKRSWIQKCLRYVLESEYLQI